MSIIVLPNPILFTNPDEPGMIPLISFSRIKTYIFGWENSLSGYQVINHRLGVSIGYIIIGTSKKTNK